MMFLRGNWEHIQEGVRKDPKNKQWNTELDRVQGQTDLDRYRGCLVGGAAGDALGYAVEFWCESEIFATYGQPGIREYALLDGVAEISDDTQMTLFTAEGLRKGDPQSLGNTVTEGVLPAYRNWLATQDALATPANSDCWLYNVPRLHARRAPGNTCLTALLSGVLGTVDEPINNSKGCGGVMRVAPVGLYYLDSQWSGFAIDLMAADVAALTHGHPLGYLPAAMLARIVRLLAKGAGITPKMAVQDSITAMQVLFEEEWEMPVLLDLVNRAVELSESDTRPLDAIHQLGAGWVGEEALAIAIYCALKSPEDFDSAMIMAVNHGGDSDSTGAIAGNILGAYLGLSRIPEKYTRDLELLDVITTMADALYPGNR